MMQLGDFSRRISLLVPFLSYSNFFFCEVIVSLKDKDLREYDTCL